MSKLLFIILQTICNIICFALVGTGAELAKAGDFREWMFIVGVVAIFLPAIIEYAILQWKWMWRWVRSDKNRD